MIARIAFTFAALSSLAVADLQRDGNAAAEWISPTVAIEPGKPLTTGIRLVIDPGWHTYWINPGEAGNAVKVTWSLPSGWAASELHHPVPKRFLTGELPGYGYEKEVIFPVSIVPPPGATSIPELKASISWLTCNDSSCVPGKVDLILKTGVPEAAQEISAASALVPKPLSGAKLTVRENGKQLSLSLTLPESAALDPAASEVFPATGQAIDHYQLVVFEKTGPTWSATAGNNEYADGPLKELTLVLFQKGAPPLEVAWKAE